MGLSGFLIGNFTDFSQYLRPFALLSPVILLVFKQTMFSKGDTDREEYQYTKEDLLSVRKQLMPPNQVTSPIKWKTNRRPRGGDRLHGA